jgi:hypothetical protein
MLLYLQPTKDADQRRCFVSEPVGQGGDFTELAMGSASITSAPDETAAPVCVHLSPSVTSIYLVLD